MTNDLDIMRELRPLFDKDPYRAGAAWVLGKPPAEVTPEERHRFKLAAYLFLHSRGADVINNEFEFTERLVNLLTEANLTYLIDTVNRDMLNEGKPR